MKEPKCDKCTSHILAVEGKAPSCKGGNEQDFGPSTSEVPLTFEVELELTFVVLRVSVTQRDK